MTVLQILKKSNQRPWLEFEPTNAFSCGANYGHNVHHAESDTYT
jgi:hypothetical protein